MGDGTRLPGGGGQWLDEFTPLRVALAALRLQDESMSCSLPFAKVGTQDPFLGGLEVAELLGVRPRTVDQWWFRRLLPGPDLVWRASKLWKRSTILRWAGDTGRLWGAELRAEYEKRWGIEPVPYRLGGRIPEPPKPRRCDGSSLGEQTPGNEATGPLTPSSEDLVGGLGHE